MTSADPTGAEVSEPTEVRRIEVPIGDDVVPGATKLSIQTKQGNVLVMVPEEARPGDRLVLIGSGAVVDASWDVKLKRPEPVAPSNGAAEAATADLRRITAKVPDDIAPGSTKIKMTAAAGEELVIMVPVTARSGDFLVMEERADGSWFLKEIQPRENEIAISVPHDAVPGETKLDVTIPGGEVLSLLVPAESLANDRLCLSFKADNAPGGRWEIRIVRAAYREALLTDLPDTLRMVHVPERVPDTYFDLVAAARSLGGTVNPKMQRGAAPPLNLMGMIATEAIAKGEILLRMPADTHLSLPCLRTVFPEICAAVTKLAVEGSIAEGREKEVAQAACFSTILRAAAARSKARTEGRALPQRPSGLHAGVLNLWHDYAESCLGLDFDNHPYFRALQSSRRVRASFAPSWEYNYMDMMAGDALMLTRMLNDDVGQELLGADMDVGSYLQSRLIFLTRVFATAHDSALVPLADLFNHSNEPGALWSWNDEHDAHEIVANQAYAPGDEIFISYGRRSNTLLFRTYAFTLPPSLEPSWTMIVSSEKPLELQALFLKYVQPSKVDIVVLMDTKNIEETLVNALNACVSNGTDAEAFLKELCETCMLWYEGHAPLAPVLAALRRVRERDPSSAAWWTDCDYTYPANEAQFSDWMTDVMRVHMSEYLCLLAHWEAVELFAGRLEEDKCLAAAAHTRATMMGAFKILKSRRLFAISPKVSEL